MYSDPIICICIRTPTQDEWHSPACIFQDNREPDGVHNTFRRFESTPASSMVSYLLILISELRDIADKADRNGDNVQKFWARDAAILVTELLIRYDRFVKKAQQVKEKM